MNLFTPSPKFADAVINHPSVRSTADLGSHRLSSAALLAEPNLSRAYDGGFMLFVRREPGVYQGHVFTLPGSRGREALTFGKAALTWLFARPEVARLVAEAPLVLPAVGVYCRRLGLKPDGRDLFFDYFSMESGQWAVS